MFQQSFLTYGPYASVWIEKNTSSLSLTLRIQDMNFVVVYDAVGLNLNLKCVSQARLLCRFNQSYSCPVKLES